MTEPAAAQPPETPPKPRLGMFWRIVLFLIFALFATGAYIAYDAMTFLRSPASAEPHDVIIDIAPGATFDRVAWTLYKTGAVRDVTRFRLLAKLRDKLGAVQAGEFTVNTGWTPDQVLLHITTGKPNLYRLALREGLPWWEVARLVEEGGFAKASEFEAVIHNPEFLRRYGIPFANAEGFLYPETYLLRKPRTLGGREQAEGVARLLVETFWKRSWPALTAYAASGRAPEGTPLFLRDATLRNNIPVFHTPQRPAAGNAPHGQTGEAVTATAPEAPPSLPVPVSEEVLRSLIILASLVEKETGVPDERARVAGVYANRIRLGMLLQCDPTIIYGLGKEQSGPIRKSQLEDPKNRYNTYQHAGLPPGPICSSGAAALAAAAAPEEHAYLFFVATGQPDGTHTFSTTITDHNRAVRVFRATQSR